MVISRCHSVTVFPSPSPSSWHGHSIIISSKDLDKKSERPRSRSRSRGIYFSNVFQRKMNDQSHPVSQRRPYGGTSIGISIPTVTVSLPQCARPRTARNRLGAWPSGTAAGARGFQTFHMALSGCSRDARKSFSFKRRC
jgi:hypothetical protein